MNPAISVPFQLKIQLQGKWSSDHFELPTFGGRKKLCNNIIDVVITKLHLAVQKIPL
jgi:hypothetical protein